MGGVIAISAPCVPAPVFAPSGASIEAGFAAGRSERPGDFAPQNRRSFVVSRESMASRCGQTL
jgi:hypothetical protein